jgi:multidrug efflux pump subunit AcrB
VFAYSVGVARVLRVSGVALALYVGLIGLTGLGFSRVPQGFVPDQDKEYLIAFARLPDAATLDRTDAVIRRMSSMALEQPGVAHAVAFPGLSVNGFVNASNSGIVFVTLDPAAERGARDLSAVGIAQALNRRYTEIQEAFVAIFPPPPVMGQGYGPDQVMHYNGYPAAEINGGPAPGFSSGQGQDAIAAILSERLPSTMGFEWTELAYQERLAGNTMLVIFPLCVLLVYIVLAARYESWSLPLTIILIVPMVLFSAIAGVWLTGGDNNVFTQISFLVLAGLACKNAILIVEFARQRESEGQDRMGAALDACRVRLRPVLMTSITFLMAVVPLVLSSGAGSEIRQAMGIAVFAGMFGVTFFGLFLTPLFYVLVGGIVERLSRRAPMTGTVAPAPMEGR